MSLKPRYEYSRQILIEIYVAMVARMIEIIGAETAIGIMSRVAGPTGFEDASRMVNVYRVNGRNAATAEYTTRVVGMLLGVETEPIKTTPGYIEIKCTSCPYSDALIRYKRPLVCETCSEYLKGVYRFIDEDIEFEWVKRMSDGDDYCLGVGKVDEPKDMIMPERTITKFLTAFGWLVTDKNKVLVRSLTTWIVSLGRLMVEIIGPAAAAVPARAAEEAGKHNGAKFIPELGLEDSLTDAARLIKEVRETIASLVEIKMENEEAELITTKCRLANKCMGEKEGKFIEAACTSYTSGLISALGSYEIEKVSGTCKHGEECRMMLRKK